MSKDIGKDISEIAPEYMMISLISSKTKVLIIGGGNAGFIKVKAFAKRGCKVYVVSKEFSKRFDDLSSLENVVLLKELYDTHLIQDKHLIVIATDDKQLNNKIKADCEKGYKIYLTCDDFKQGMFVTPVQKRTENMHVALNTIMGSPKTSGFLISHIEEHMSKYDEFVFFLCNLRNSIKDKANKNEIMDFVNTEDFYDFYQAGIHVNVIKMFYPEINLKSRGGLK